MTTDLHPRLEVIQCDECLRLLAGDEIGRLAVISGNTPIVLPVNYALDGETVVFRTDSGTKLDRGPRARASSSVATRLVVARFSRRGRRRDRARRSGCRVAAARSPSMGVASAASVARG
ncbi:MAG: pyridoxamine 5'-phosphate oxidase family protein [Acidimicrobiales bacterium]